MLLNSKLYYLIQYSVFMKVLLKSGQKEYLIDSKQKEFHCNEGMIKWSKVGSRVKSNTAVWFSVLKAGFLDRLLRAKRGPAVVLPKDFGAIVAYTGLGKNWICVDAGSGSGWLACQLSRVAKKVVTYEARKDFYELAKANISELGCRNVTIKNKDASLGFSEQEVDLITLDLLDPERIPFAKSLKIGGYCVAYLPHIEQAAQFVKALPSGLVLEKILDVRVDEYLVSGKIKRSEIRHTAFLVFVRKVN